MIQQHLGRGGMAEVYRAYDPVLDRSVAIKVILPHLTLEASFAERFLREAKLVASLRHPHLVQLFDFDFAGDQPYMVMEYLGGDSLKARLAALRHREETMPLGEIARLLDAVVSALDYAHAQGAVHRDVKPANILFTSQNEPVLADFGIARLLDESAPIDSTGSIVGTPAYMSPEQAAGKAVDLRSDLYALGVLVYELATGRLPFQGDSPAAILRQHLSVSPPPPRIHNQDLPVTVEQVILQSLAKEPVDRFASAGDFARAFRTALHRQSLGHAGHNEAAASNQAEALLRPFGSHQSQPPPMQFSQEQLIDADKQRVAFVARERELARLQEFLNQALLERGQICIIVGEAGTGKTALVTEFARRAQMTYPDLVVAAGSCNTQSGAGDPYLPFREMLSRLLGLTATGLTEELTPQAASEPPASYLRLFAQALAEHGPDLIDIFVSGDALIGQLEDAVTDRSDWMARLEGLVQHKAQATGGATGIEQRHIFEQYTNVLKTLATQHPMLLLVDDLQWVDAASADLLFHLSRRIGQDRILIVGAQRPDEVMLGRADGPHPLEKILAELKRYFGDIQITLQLADKEAGRQFVDALLDTQPNRLSEGFRQALFQHTGGHALFTVELLRHMQEQGVLTQDETGHWVAEPVLDWEELPPRVEGVIEERIGRLTEDLREVLTIASVEGENFTAEVVAHLQSIDARVLIRRLSRELERQHRLVGATGYQRVGRQRLSLFRFQHNLFQKYLYNHLNAVERSCFHEDVGTVLEELYGETTGEIAVQLAWHFTEAGLPEKARHYLAIAGEQARRRYANTEALSYLNRALDLTPETDYTEQYTLLLARQKVYDVLADRDAQRQDLAQLEELAQRLNDHRRQAEIALCQTLYDSCIGEYRTAVTHTQRAIELAASVQDVELEAKGYQQWGRALLNLSDYAESQSKLEQALALADAEQLHQVKADSLRALGVVSYYLGDYHNAATTYERALTIYQEVGDRRGEGYVLSNLGLTFREQGKLVAARHYFDRVLQLYQEIGDRDGEADVLVNLGLTCRDQGDYTASHSYYEQALAICRQTGARSAEAFALLGLGDVYKDQDAFDNAVTYYEQALFISRAIGDRRQEHLALKELANTALSLGDYTTARGQYEQALTCFREIGDRQSECATLNRLGLLYHSMGDYEAARTFSQEAQFIAQEIGDPWLEASSLTKLGHALAGLGLQAEAAGCYENAVESWRAFGRPDLALESVAGLARLALERNDTSQALRYAEELIIQFEDDTFPNEGMAEEFLTCYRVLEANGDARAGTILRTVYHQLQTGAAKIDNSVMRKSFLESSPVHREIVSAWHTMRNASSDDPSESATIVE